MGKKRDRPFFSWANAQAVIGLWEKIGVEILAVFKPKFILMKTAKAKPTVCGLHWHINLNKLFFIV